MATPSKPEPVIVDAANSPHTAVRPVPLTSVTLQDSFWKPRRDINREVTIPSQFRHIEETDRLNNFRRAAGRKDLSFVGIYFNDSDVYKWLEAAGSALAEGDPDGTLTEMVDTAIDAVAAAQEPDGYLNTYFTYEKTADRWKNLRDMHEMYCAGHLFQGAVAHYRATGSEKLLNVARRFADNIASVFGTEEGKRPGACGHPEAEMALVELYRATGETRYLDLAQQMVDARGQKPSALGAGGAYHQDHIPFRELHEVIGHAVRMVYLSAGATDLYLERGEAALKDALDAQWENRTTRRMYVSGGLGSRWEGEAFGKDYELPNARAYTETCAAIGGVMWDWRMLLATGDAKYADMIEHTLYNAVLPGLSLDGQAYFYQNPLEDDGKHRRQPWFGCACCPPNVARLLAQLPGYFYGASGDAVYVHLYAQGKAQIPLANGRTVALSQQTAYPFDGDIRLTVQTDGDFALRLRVPAWCEPGVATLTVNGEPANIPLTPGAYAEVRRAWKAGDTVRLSLPIPARYVEAHPYVWEDAGHVAVLRGPILYCLEQADIPGVDPRDVVLPADPASLRPIARPDLLGGVTMLEGTATVAPPAPDWNGTLYRTIGSVPAAAKGTPTPVTLIPYYAWANREPGRMQVWLRR